MLESIGNFFGLVYAIMQIGGLVAAVHVLFAGRSEQGTAAWALALAAFPLIALPLYLTVGMPRFRGYVRARRAGNTRLHTVAEHLGNRFEKFRANLEGETEVFQPLEKLGRLPFSHSNNVRLLIDGEAFFEAVFHAIERAEDYILIQFFIVRADALGQRVKARLMEKAREGLRVYLLFDEVGSRSLPGSFIQDLEEAGVQVSSFNGRQGLRRYFRINFRNHRKLVCVDGVTAFITGHNIGNEYLGKHKRFGPWRDTGGQVDGPAVQSLQIAFAEDWFWARGELPEINWTPTPSSNGNMRALVIPTGPADEEDTCALFFVQCINAARERCWISSPYFVPDEKVVGALKLAALRGVDVRILLPEKPDHLLVYLSSFSYLDETCRSGVKIYRYTRGFMHQKTILIDDHLAAIGTANLDNRSFRINFEELLAVADPKFARGVKLMLDRDFSFSRQTGPEDYHERTLLFRIGVRLARLLAPLQ